MLKTNFDETNNKTVTHKDEMEIQKSIVLESNSTASKPEVM